MKLRHILIHLALLSTASACFHHAPNPEDDPQALAAMRPQLRMVGRDSSWVTRSQGYELIGRSEGDLVLVHASLERAAATMRRIFPNDTLATLVATVRRIPAEGQPFASAAPVPMDNKLPVVEIIIPDPKAKRDDDARMRIPMFGLRDPAVPAIRAWLSAHASAKTHTVARQVQASGEIPDARVPGWAADMIATLSQDSLVDQSAVELAAHQDAIISLNRFFTMEAPTPESMMAQRADREGRPPVEGGGMAGAMGGGMGGRGGRGGMGGGRGGNRGGGNRGGDENRGESARPFSSGMAYAAEATALGRYMSREGYDFIGSLIDAQIAGQSIDEAFAKKQTSTAQAEKDFRLWLIERASAVNGRR